VAQRNQPNGSADPRANRILAALGSADYDEFMAETEVVTLPLNDRLFGREGRVDAVYFPVTCMVSVLAGPPEGDLTEAATIGREGGLDT